MKTRAITGFFFVIVMLGSTLLGPLTFDIFYLVLSSLCLFEFYRLIKQSNIEPLIIFGIITGVVLYMAFLRLAMDNSDPPMNHYLLALVPCVVAIFIQELFRKSQAPFTNIAYTIFGLLYT